MSQTRRISPFSGNEAADADTEKGRNETRDGSERGVRGETDDERDRDTRDDRAPPQSRRASLSDGVESTDK